jgi:uncharacterized protein
MTAAELLPRAIDFLLTCFSVNIVLGLIPAFLIAGGVNVFVPQQWISKYFGNKANPVLSYGAATIAGIVISV